MDRWRLFLTEHGIPAAEALASNFGAEADRLQQAAMLDLDICVNLKEVRKWMEEIPEDTLLALSEGRWIVDTSLETSAITEFITRTEALRQNQNAHDFHESSADKNSEYSGDLLIHSYMIRRAILEEGKRFSKSEQLNTNESLHPTTPFPFNPAEEVMYRPDGVKRLRSNAVWPRISQWIINQIIIIDKNLPDIHNDNDLAKETNRCLQDLIASDNPGEYAWVVDIVVREMQKRAAPSGLSDVPVPFGREQLRDLKGPTLAGDFGTIEEPWLDVLRRIFQRGEEGG